MALRETLFFALLLAGNEPIDPSLAETIARLASADRATRVDAYRTRQAHRLPPEARTALQRGEVDAVTFTSASTVRGFLSALGQMKGNPRVVCIGPVTARAARERGLHVHAVASPHTIEGLVAAVERALARSATRAGAPRR